MISKNGKKIIYSNDQKKKKKTDLEILNKILNNEKGVNLLTLNQKKKDDIMILALQSLGIIP